MLGVAQAMQPPDRAQTRRVLRRRSLHGVRVPDYGHPGNQAAGRHRPRALGPCSSVSALPVEKALSGWPGRHVERSSCWRRQTSLLMFFACLRGAAQPLARALTKPWRDCMHGVARPVVFFYTDLLERTQLQGE
jgi:hypothetical protein